MNRNASFSSFLQLQQQIDHLRLDRDIKRGDGLISNDHLRVKRESAGDADTLALPAGELMGVAMIDIIAHADSLQELTHPFACAFRGFRAVGNHRLGNAVADAHTRIETGIGVLENHLHAPPHVAERGFICFQDILTSKLDRSAGRLGQPDNRAARSRFAATGFADQREGFAGLNIEGDILDGVHAAGQATKHAFTNVKILGEVLHLEYGRTRSINCIHACGGSDAMPVC